MKRPAPRAVGDLLLSALPQISDRLTHFRLRQAWGTIVGRDVARRSRPDSFVGGTLRVVVDNSPWLHEMTLREAELVTKVRDRFPEVRALRFTLGALETEPASALEAAPRAVPLTAADHADIDAATAAITDESVADAARRLLVTARRFPRTRSTGPSPRTHLTVMERQGPRGAM
jgi:hypothetical protein